MKKGDYFLIKNSKAFMPKDIILYVLTAIIVLSLFLIFVIFQKAPSASGFNILLNEKTLLTYTANDSSIEISNEFSDCVEYSVTNDNYLITIFSNKEKTHFNKISIDRLNHTVDVIDASCSTSKECVHMPKISSQGFIYCAVYDLKIIPTSSGGFAPPVVG